MNGRLEAELKAEEKMSAKLAELPEIFSEFYYSMRAAKKSYTTLSVYINYVKNFADFVTKNNISNDFYTKVTPTIIEQYFISLETREVNGKLVRIGDSILQTRWSALNTFFDFLVNRKECLAKNPFEKTVRPKNNTEHQVTFMNKTEINKVKKCINKNNGKNQLRDRTIISLALATGLRVSALVGINLEDINLEENTIKVIEKRSKTKLVPIGDNMKEILVEYLDWRSKTYPEIDTDALFISNKKGRISTDAVREIVGKYTEVVDGKHITPHKLRASAATNMISSGIDVTTVAKILGHSNISTTMRYVGAIDEEKNKAVDMLDRLI